MFTILFVRIVTGIINQQIIKLEPTAMYTNRSLSQFSKPSFLPAVILLIVLVFIPDLIIWLSLPEGSIFNGALVNIDDLSVYFSAIRQGAEGAWLFTPQFTPEGLPAHLAFIPYLIIGKFQSAIGGAIFFWFYLLRLISLIIAVISLENLVKTVFPHKPNTQTTALFFIFFSGGLGWVMFLLTKQATLLTPDLTAPEWNTITSAFSAPHFLLGISSQAFFFSSFLKVINDFSIKHFSLLTFAGIALGLSYPFLIAVNGLVLAVFFVSETIKLKRIPLKLIFYSGLACSPMIAYIIYYGIVLPKDPVWQLSLVANNKIISPPPLGIAIGFGILLLLLLISINSARTITNLRLIILWFGANLVSLYLPVSFSGRFLLGLYIPVSILAAYSLEDIVLARNYSKSSQKKGPIRKATLWLTLPSTIIFIIWAIMATRTNPGYPFYFNQNEIRALQWLAEKSTAEDTILADYPISNLIPRYANGLVFTGHLNLTIKLEEKLELIEVFWNPKTSDQWRESFIKRWGITFIYQGRFENRFTNTSPIHLPYKIVYSSDDIVIYKIE